MTRRRESLDAMVHLDPPKIEWLGFRDGDPPVVNNLTNALVACMTE